MRFALLTAALLFGCTSSSPNPTPAFDGGDLGCTPKDPVPPLDDGAVGGRCNCDSAVKTSTIVGASCTATVKQWPYEGGDHQTPGTKIVYCSKPPNSGPHYFVWAAYKTYTKPIDPGFLVHSLEHGAVVLWYRCASADECPGVAKAIADYAAARPADPVCDVEGGPRNRMIVVPDPTLPTKFAISAHQWTYSADCFEPASFTKFVDAHYGHGPEDLCTDGTDPGSIEVDAGSDSASDAASGSDAASEAASD